MLSPVDGRTGGRVFAAERDGIYKELQRDSGRITVSSVPVQATGLWRTKKINIQVIYGHSTLWLYKVHVKRNFVQGRTTGR